MSRLLALPKQCLLCVLVTAGMGCRVYDAQLLRQVSSASRADRAGASADQDAALDADIWDESRPLPGCGNGWLDEAESCDIEIPAGEPGACPESCGDPDGCFTSELVGQRCGARCVSVEIAEPSSGDGCCPSGATPDTDSDCSGTCGNGERDEGETCDPPASCVRAEECKTDEVCKVARFTGAAETCSARCQILPVTECVSGDGCCLPGCSGEGDSDCEPVAASTGLAGDEPGPASSGSTEGPSGEAECTSAELCPESAGSQECAQLHAGGRCESCDCAYCAAEVLACESGDASFAGCPAVAKCARENHCDGWDCFCGGASVSACQTRPRGPCLWEIYATAGTRDVLTILVQANTAGTPLSEALKLVQCRSDHCGRICGL